MTESNASPTIDPAQLRNPTRDPRWDALRAARHDSDCACGLGAQGCQARIGEAWRAGFDDARADTYDCRPFTAFRHFTAYGRGWEAGR